MGWTTLIYIVIHLSLFKREERPEQETPPTGHMWPRRINFAMLMLLRHSKNTVMKVESFKADILFGH